MKFISKLLVVAVLFSCAGTIMLSAKCSKKDGTCSTSSCDKDGRCGKKGGSCRTGSCR